MYTQKIITIVLAGLAIASIVYLIMSYNTNSLVYEGRMPRPGSSPAYEYGNEYGTSPKEHFENSPSGLVSAGSGAMPSFTSSSNVDASEDIQYIEQPQNLTQVSDGTGSQMNQLPSECYPKDVLSSADLLPKDANSLWAQVSPSGQGSLADQNFLTSGFHIGINTVGQTLRNANRQLRSEPLNPQVKVSPWQQTTIEPDINRRPLEIEGQL